MGISPKLQEGIVSLTKACFADTIAIIVWGSSAESGFDPKLGDVDLLIVIDSATNTQIHEIQVKLNELINKLNPLIDLDPSVISKQALPSMELVTSYGTRTAHGMDLYQIMEKGKLIYGDESIVKLFPETSFDEALSDVIPYIKDRMIQTLKSSLGESKNLKDFIKINKDLLFVVIRTMYSIDQKDTATKAEAAKYIKQNYPELESFAEFMELIYQKSPDEDLPHVKKDELQRALEITEEKIDQLIA